MERGVASKSVATSTYICGPGRSWIRETGEFIDGSPLVAFESAAKHGDQFTDLVLADSRQEYVAAAQHRLQIRGARPLALQGSAHDVIDRAIQALDPEGLHFAFLDPFSLGALPFDIIRKLGSVKRMDLLVHVSAMDLKRDLHNYVRPGASTDLDRFAPGWREKVNIKQRQDIIRKEIFDHWGALIKDLGTSPNDCVEVVENSKSAELYWLVFIARHRLAHKLWDAVANISPQGRLFR